MSHLTFRSSRIIYYGPFACQNCGVLICKMAREFGGNAFTYPEGPIYPNTEWYAHVCDPKRVAQHAPPAPANADLPPSQNRTYYLTPEDMMEALRKGAHLTDPPSPYPSSSNSNTASNTADPGFRGAR